MRKVKNIEEDIVKTHNMKESAVRTHSLGYAVLLFVLLVLFQTVQLKLFTPFKKSLFANYNLNEFAIFNFDPMQYAHWLYFTSYLFIFIAFCFVAHYIAYELIAFLYKDRG